jgi:replicative DNA helicase
MKGKRIVMRMLASRSRVNMRNIRDGFMSERDFPKITGSATKLAVAPIHIVETSDLSISQLKAKCRQVAAKQGIKFIGIDYLQLVKGNLRRDGNREQEVASISRGVKELAGEMYCPVMVLSQLNDDGKLRESRAIGQDADSLWKLSPEDTENTNDCIPVNLEMRKQRDGPAPFTVKLTFLKQFTRFECAARIAPEDSNLPFKDS